MTTTQRRAAAAALLLVTGCGVEETGIPPPLDAFWYPVGMAAHPDGRYLYVANSVFDRKYNRGTVVAFDTFTNRILPEATVEIGLFAGEMRVVRRDGVVRAYVPTRDDNQLNVLTIDATAGEGPDHLACDHRPGDGGARECGGTATIDLFEGQLKVEPLAADPLGLAVDAEGLFVTHVGRGVVSRWGFGEAQPLDFRCSLSLQAGATSVAVHPLLDWAYVTDRAGELVQVVAPLDPGELGQRGVTTREKCRLEPRTPIQVDDAFDGASTRGIAFSADGTLLYVANTIDESLRIYDTSVGAGGVPRNRLVAAIPLGGGADVVRVAGLRPGERAVPVGPGAPGAVDLAVAEKGQGLVYVTAFDDDRVVVVDPTSLSVVARIDVGDGPHEIAFMPDGDGRLRGYVANFGGQSLSVLDLEPGSPRRFTLLAIVPPTESR